MRSQSCSNHRLTASNCSARAGSPLVEGRASVNAYGVASRGTSVSPLCRLRPPSLGAWSNCQVNSCQSRTVLRYAADGIDQPAVAWRHRRSPSAIFSASAVGIDRAVVDIEQRDVVVHDLVEQDDELDQVRVGLLPERLLALSRTGCSAAIAMPYASA